MRLKTYILRLAIILLIAASASSESEPDPSLFPFRLTDADLPGWTKLSTSFHPEMSPMGAIGHPELTASTFPLAWDTWYPSSEVAEKLKPYSSSINCKYAICSNRQSAALALSNFRMSVSAALDPIKLTDLPTDIVIGSIENGYYLMVLDQAIVSINVEGSNSTDAQRLLRLVHERLFQQGMRPGTPFNVSKEEIVSPKIIYSIGQEFLVRLEISTDSSYLPIRARATFYPDDAVPSQTPLTFKREELFLSGDVQLRWDGTDPQGSRVPEGSYRVRLYFEDLLGRGVERSYVVEVTEQDTSKSTLHLGVLSKHVKPHKNEQARVQATATNPPTTLSYSIYPGGQGGPPQGPPVLTVQGLSAPSGALELVWDGTDASGQRVPNGSYVMVVTARDSTGSESSEAAHLVVNFQGGGQGARSLWQLARLSPGDALGLAFPIPYLGAKLALSSMFSPAQLSSKGHELSN